MEKKPTSGLAVTGLVLGIIALFSSFVPLLNVLSFPFVLLAIIGGNMIREAVGQDEEDCDPSLAPLAMLVLAVATSIDALAVGVTFAFLRVDIVPAVALIGTCTFLISAAGVKVGNVFGARYKSKAELFGGGVLVLIGLKILLEHLGLLPF